MNRPRSPITRPLCITAGLALCLGCAPESPKADQPGMDRSEATAVTGQKAAPPATPPAAAPAPAAPLEDPGAEVPRPVTRLVTVLSPTEGNTARGLLAFTRADDGLQIEGEFSGLPAGSHGFHLHQFGDCSGADGKTAGTHFNLKGSSETPPKDIDRITGNLGEIVAGEDGRAKISARVPGARIDGAYGIVGRAVVVHAKGNDPQDPPMGAAGARLACGVVGIGEAPR